MGKKKPRRIKRKVNRNLLLILPLILLAVFVIATAPTIPVTLSPVNDTAFFGEVNLTCSGSTDAEGDNISIEFILNPDNLTTGESLNGSGEYFFRNSFTDWPSQQTFCQNFGTYWDMVVIQDATENAVVAALDDADGTFIAYTNLTGTFQWEPIGKRQSSYTNWLGGFPDGKLYTALLPAANWNTNDILNQRDTVCEYFGLPVNNTIQNSSSTSYNYNLSTSYGSYSWTCRACDNNSECSNRTDIRSFNLMNYTTCASGNIALNLTYINESDNTAMDGVINNLLFTFDSNDVGDYDYSFTNLVEKSENLFCLNPTGKDIGTTGTIIYSATGFPQRTVSFSETQNGNTQINQALYLLPLSDGIYVTFSVIDNAGAPVSGVTVSAATIISGSSVIVASGTTDAAGLVTFWLNPNTLHTITSFKSGVGTNSFSIVPALSSYTITLGGAGVANQSSTFFGITYNILPTNISLNNNTLIDFVFNISDSQSNLTTYGFSLYNSTGDFLGSQVGNNPVGSTLTLNLDTNNHSTIRMDYFWNINGAFTNQSKSWNIRTNYVGELSIKNFFNDFSRFAAVGFGAGYNSFGNILISIFILVAVTGGVCFAFGIFSPIGISSIVFILTFLLEAVNLMPPLIRKYLLTAMVGAIFFALVLEERSR